MQDEEDEALHAMKREMNQPPTAGDPRKLPFSPNRTREK